MDLTIMNRQVGDVSVVSPKGRIILGEGSSYLRHRIMRLVNDGEKKIVLNMADVTYIDSAGLGMLVSAHVSAQNRGTTLCLSYLGNMFREVLQLTRLLTIFDVYDTEAEAISGFAVAPLATAAKAN
jgi:anti-sigma B factor antagonist